MERFTLAQNEMGQALGDYLQKATDLLELSAEEQETLAAIVAPYEAILPKRKRGRSMPPMLKVNERVRLEPGGTLYRVVRVNSCAAYVKPVYAQAKLVEFATPGGHNHSFLATGGGSIIAISPFSFVYREQ